MNWRDCIVIYIDLVDVKKLASSGKGSSVMRAFHRIVANEMKVGLRSLEHAYAWNDSVLLLAYVDKKQRGYEKCLREVDELKVKIDRHVPSYAIAVKGQTFPVCEAMPSRVTVLRTSSYAMANCFQIEKAATEGNIRKTWYIDSRIVNRVKSLKGSESLKLKFLPDNEERDVYLFDGQLWQPSAEQTPSGRSGRVAP